MKLKIAGFPDPRDKDIVYKDKTITIKFPSGYCSIYSDKEKRFLTFDNLESAKSHIDKTDKTDKTASKKRTVKTIKISKKEWERIGRTAGWNNSGEDVPQRMTREEAEKEMMDECNFVLERIKKKLPEAESKLEQGQIPYGIIDGIYSMIRQLDQSLGFYQKDYEATSDN